MSQNHIHVSKFLSLVLRHQPDVVGMELEPGGWLDIDQLVENSNARGKRLDRTLLLDVVASNDKQRFVISEDGAKIRASQGHSVSTVELGLTPTVPPEQLLHGTVVKFLAAIRDEGLLKRNRNHVHLSADRLTAQKVAQRRGRPVVLLVNSGQMHRDGLTFFRSENNVWLTDKVPVQYLTFPEASFT